MRSILLLAIGLSILLARRGNAQENAAPPCSFDTAAHLRMDSVLIALAPGPRLGNKTELRDEYLAAAEAIHGYFHRPPRITLPIWARTFAVKGFHLASDDPPYGFDGDVRFQLDATGRLVNESVQVETLAADLGASVVAAIRRADSARAFAPPSRQVRKDDAMIRLHFAAARGDKVPGPLLLRVIVPALRLDIEPSVRSIRRLQYPPNLRRANITDRVVLQFVIHRDGRADLNSLSVVQGHFRDFVTEVIDALETARFSPGAIEKCVVPTLVRLPFDFKIRGAAFSVER